MRVEPKALLESLGWQDLLWLCVVPQESKGVREDFLDEVA